MKQLTFLYIALLMLSTGAQAQTIDVGTIKSIYTADAPVTSSNSASCESSQTAANCDFEQSFNAGTYVSNTTLNDLVTRDFNTSVKSPVETNAQINLGFTSSMYGGAGDDLVLFFVGNSTSFGLNVYDKPNSGESATLISTGTYDITTSNAVFNYDRTWICIGGSDDKCTGGYPLSAFFIDFGATYDGVEIGDIQLTFGNGFNGSGSSNFSLAGGFHADYTVVPLPLPIVLFSSGLALLGWIGRRKTL